jgi:hypothetical protein
MSYLHKFGRNDILQNRIITRPQYEFVMYKGSIYVNNDKDLGTNIPDGTISLYEYNVDRDGTTQGLIFPYIIKDGYHTTIGSVTGSIYSELPIGSQITGSYPLTSSIGRQLFPATTSPANVYTAASSDSQVIRQELDAYVTARKEIISLKNTMNSYRNLSNKYEYSGWYVSGSVNLVKIPSIFFSDGIQKGSVSLKFYFTGSLLSEATDSQRNGELISTQGGTSGDTVGVVLYNEGFIMLTASADISTVRDDYANAGDGSSQKASWLYFGAYGTNTSASAYSLSFNGTQKIPSMTMFATAQPGEINNSLNPTWVSSSYSTWRNDTAVSENGYVEPTKTKIKNTVQSEYCNYDDDFEKQVFISEVGIFDRNKNLLGVAKLANPVLKKEVDNYTFKLNLDM